MENIILAYALGILTIVFIAFIVGAVRANIMVSRHEKQIEGLKNDISQTTNILERNIDERCDRIEHDQYTRDDLIERRIDGEIDRVNGIERSVLAYTDSRLDKLEYRLTGGSSKTPELN